MCPLSHSKAKGGVYTFTLSSILLLQLSDLRSRPCVVYASQQFAQWLMFESFDFPLPLHFQIFSILLYTPCFLDRFQIHVFTILFYLLYILHSLLFYYSILYFTLLNCSILLSTVLGFYSNLFFISVFYFSLFYSISLY